MYASRRRVVTVLADSPDAGSGYASSSGAVARTMRPPNHCVSVFAAGVICAGPLTSQESRYSGYKIRGMTLEMLAADSKRRTERKMRLFAVDMVQIWMVSLIISR